jgi:hypothetical protein
MSAKSSISLSLSFSLKRAAQLSLKSSTKVQIDPSQTDCCLLTVHCRHCSCSMIGIVCCRWVGSFPPPLPLSSRGVCLPPVLRSMSGSTSLPSPAGNLLGIHACSNIRQDEHLHLFRLLRKMSCLCLSLSLLCVLLVTQLLVSLARTLELSIGRYKLRKFHRHSIERTNSSLVACVAQDSIECN